MLKIEQLSVWVKDKEILSNINLSFDLWKNYIIVWKNWSWKSSLFSFLIWNPDYIKLWWSILLWDKDIALMKPFERNNEGIFLAFQNVPEIEWLNMLTYLKALYSSKQKKKNPEFKWISLMLFKKLLDPFIKNLNIDPELLKRDLNFWFSWWEKRKFELLQAMLSEPKYLILDEIDSWLDIDAYKDVMNALKNYQNDNISIIAVTHKFDMIDFVKFDEVVILENWKIKESWDIKLLEKIKIEGFLKK